MLPHFMESGSSASGRKRSLRFKVWAKNLPQVKTVREAVMSLAAEEWRAYTRVCSYNLLIKGACLNASQ